MNNGQLKEVSAAVTALKRNISHVFVGKETAIHQMLIGFFSGLHVLIEDIPGLGKTTLAMTLAKSSGLDFGRIQFTPDILPGDILGMTVWSAEQRDFIYKEGAIMHQFILADEINRASARTQSSLLEAMQEQTVSIDGKTISLPTPFFVVATQNPGSFAGTFMLPESQTDRFGLSLTIGYPSEDDEVSILERFRVASPINEITPVMLPETVISVRSQVRNVLVDDKIKRFMVAIADNTRKSAKIRLGMSPRATQHLLTASQTQAIFSERNYVIPEDVLDTVHAVLAHRLVLSAEAKVNSQTARQVIDEVLEKTPVPTGV
ncbi:MAG: MoxR family ATPase [Spirochaetales bacterium]|jgi:MoxR-like ATPase|nr:MoxR family ATPase [Spirochaetales bacterium]